MTALFDIVADHEELAELDPAERRLALRALLHERLDDADAGFAVAEIANTIDGFGPLTESMSDPAVTDVLVNGPDDVWVERDGRLSKSSVAIEREDLEDFVGRLARRAGVRADASHPIADGRLPDGSRLHVVVPPVAARGPILSIRCFPEAVLELPDLVGRGMLTEDQARHLADCVRDHRSIAISGPTGSGKTTLLNALLSQIGPEERVVIIEETAELRPSCDHWVSLLSRDANVEGRGEVTLEELVRAALRMRPDRIVVGEIRGAEAHAALSAMSVGHEGSMVTVHARSTSEVVDRFVSLALARARGCSEDFLRRQVTRALALLVHVGRDDEGRRRVLEIADLR